MPIYVYACTNCGERTEAKQGFNDPPLEECPHCAGKLRKMYSPVGIVFKGSGFYSTDAKRSGSTTKPSGSDSSGSDSSGDASSTSGTSEGKKSESAPAKKSSKEEKSA